ncbi:unnamed protein product [Cyclocybe aegerita]|uniref:Uncharacterized protein n=1 Tax=Cyclocybe aegerita TaxID=1973307 RepID=A0A8S0WFD1_CYCAE|nr:unnamed protein product [Cyclocybe aegerita]
MSAPACVADDVVLRLAPAVRPSPSPGMWASPLLLLPLSLDDALSPTLQILAPPPLELECCAPLPSSRDVGDYEHPSDHPNQLSALSASQLSRLSHSHFPSTGMRAMPFVLPPSFLLSMPAAAFPRLPLLSSTSPILGATAS